MTCRGDAGHVAYMCEEEVHIKFWVRVENLKGRDHLQRVGVDRILKLKYRAYYRNIL
jgi:hypothetical protein